MDASRLFELYNAGVMPFWLLLIVAPRWRWTGRLVHSALVPAILGCSYVALLLASPPPPEGGSFTSLDGVLTLLDSPEGMLVGWIHYLVFDLFVGAWELRDSQRHAIPHLAVVPCLVLTLMLGPAGLLAYLLLRGAMRREWTLVEASPAEPTRV
jgi:hypothetical protein